MSGNSAQISNFIEHTPVVRGADISSFLLERLPHSLWLADSLCHPEEFNPIRIPWKVVDFIMGGQVAREHRDILPIEYRDVMDRVTAIKANMGKAAAPQIDQERPVPLVARVDTLSIPHHTVPVVERATWIGALTVPYPRFTIERRGAGSYGVRLDARIMNRHTGTDTDCRYVGDSIHPRPPELPGIAQWAPVYGFWLGQDGIEPGDGRWPSLVFGRESIIGAVRGSTMASDETIRRLDSCLSVIEGSLSCLGESKP